MFNFHLPEMLAAPIIFLDIVKPTHNGTPCKMDVVRKRNMFRCILVPLTTTKLSNVLTIHIHLSTYLVAIKCSTYLLLTHCNYLHPLLTYICSYPRYWEGKQDGYKIGYIGRAFVTQLWLIHNGTIVVFNKGWLWGCLLTKSWNGGLGMAQQANVWALKFWNNPFYLGLIQNNWTNLFQEAHKFNPC